MQKFLLYPLADVGGHAPTPPPIWGKILSFSLHAVFKQKSVNTVKHAPAIWLILFLQIEIEYNLLRSVILQCVL